MTSVSEEKKLNPRLTKSREEFVKIMNELGLPYPKKIGESISQLFLILRLLFGGTFEIKYEMLNSRSKRFHRF